MSKSKFPKPKTLLDAEFEGWKFVFKSIEDLEKRIKALEVRMSAIILE